MSYLFAFSYYLWGSEGKNTEVVFLSLLQWNTFCQKQKMLRRGSKNTQRNYTKKDLHNPDNHDDVITNREPDILECEGKWALESMTTNKASRGNGIPVELFQILKDDAVKVLHSIFRQIWKT